MLASAHDPTRTRRLDLAHGQLAYDLLGDSGPLVVLAPGLGDLRQSYRFLAPELAAAGYRVASVDLRGHGGSSTGWPAYTPEAAAADLLALIDELGGPAVVAGNSFSAASAVWAALEDPEAVSGVVLIGPFVRDLPVGFVQRLAMPAVLHGPWKVRAWAAYLGSLYPSRKPADFAGYRERLRTNLAEPGRFAAVRAMVAASKAAVGARLAELRVPTLVVMGSADPDFPDPEAEARWIAERTGGEVAMIDGAGHYPHAEFPEVTAPRIRVFLDRVAPVGVARGA